MIKLSKGWMILILLAAMVPLLGPSNYVMYVLNLVGIYAICTMALNLLTGVGGQISIGHAGFLGIGAYASALMDLKLGIPFWIGILLAGLFTAIIGFIVGLPAVRLSGHYLAIATLGFGVAVPQITLKWDSLTGGYMGLAPNSPSLGFFTFDSETSFYYIVLFFIVVCYWTMSNIIKSRYGRMFFSIRDSEVAAQAMGVHLPSIKAFVFAVSAFFTGIAGSLYAHGTNFISPNDFTIEISFIILAMMVVGGFISLGGSIAGAAILFILGQLTSHMHGLSAVITGVVMITVILFFPNGAAGLKDKAVDLFNKSRNKSANNEGAKKHAS